MTLGRSLRRCWRSTRTWGLRAASISSGLYLEYREIFVVQDAQTILVVAGFWLMAVPPAQWYDSLKHVSAAAKILTGGQSDEEPEDEARGRRRGDR